MHDGERNLQKYLLKMIVILVLMMMLKMMMMISDDKNDGDDDTIWIRKVGGFGGAQEAGSQ